MPKYRKYYLPHGEDPTVVYSGTDIRVYGVCRRWRHEITDPSDPDNSTGSVFMHIANLATIAISSYRDIGSPRALGTTNPKGFTYGTRTYAGSMVFTIFNREPLWEFLLMRDDYDLNRLRHLANYESQMKYVNIDQLPPLDFHIIHSNEIGDMSLQSIFGIKFITHGKVMSIEDLFSEKTCQYKALDVTPLVPYRRGMLEDINPNNKMGTPVSIPVANPRTFGDIITGEAAREILKQTRNSFK